MKNDKQITEDLSLRVAGFLSDAGCMYDLQFDNRGGKRARYLFVRKPIAAKIRVSGHPSDRVEKDIERSRIPVFDIGPRRMSFDDFAASFNALLMGKVAAA
jgi:hypothetical protein